MERRKATNEWHIEVNTSAMSYAVACRLDPCVRARHTNKIRNSSCASYLSRLAVCDYAVTLRHAKFPAASFLTK